VPVDRLIERARQAAAPHLEARHVRLVCELETSLPPVLADTDRLAHVFTNLLDNALRFSAEGEVITIRARRDGAFVRLSVEDTGAGIAPSDLPRVFDRFYRGAHQPVQSGAGLGLAIVKEVIEAHGGSVSVESVPGRGSAFHFTLRAADGGATPAAGTRTASRP
jgi:signal transduction histidine kinase